MAKKNFKGGLDSLIENSLGIRKSGKKGEMRGNPIDLLPEQKQDDDKEEKDFFFKADKTEKPKKEADNKAKENGAATEIAEAPKAAEAADTKVTEAAEAAETAEAPKVTEVPEAAETTEAAKVTEAPEAAITTEAAEAPKVAETAVATEAAATEDTEADESEKVEVKTVIKTPTIEVEANDSEKNVFLKNLVADLRKELFLWRNGKINVQSFNATLHSHGLKYNPDNNEIEEF